MSRSILIGVAVVGVGAMLAVGFTVFIVVPAIQGTTWSDSRRIDQLADDEIFAGQRYRADDHGSVSITVYLFAPGAANGEGPDDGWIGQASLDVGFVADGDLGGPQATKDLSCLQ